MIPKWGTFLLAQLYYLLRLSFPPEMSTYHTEGLNDEYDYVIGTFTKVSFCMCVCVERLRRMASKLLSVKRVRLLVVIFCIAIYQ